MEKGRRILTKRLLIIRGLVRVGIDGTNVHIHVCTISSYALKNKNTAITRYKLHSKKIIAREFLFQGLQCITDPIFVINTSLFTN